MNLPSFGDAVIEASQTGNQANLRVRPERIVAVCEQLKSAQNLRFEDIIKAMRVLINTQQQEIRRLRQTNQDLSYELSQLRTKP